MRGPSDQPSQPSALRRGHVALLLAALLLLIAQFRIAVRLSDYPERALQAAEDARREHRMGGDPMFAELDATMTSDTALFHALGGMLTLAALVLLLWPGLSNDELRSLWRGVLPALGLLLYAHLLWLAWVTRGVSDKDPVNLIGGSVGALLGLVLPVWALVRLLRLPQGHERAPWMAAIAVFAWLWSLGFAARMFMIGVSA